MRQKHGEQENAEGAVKLGLLAVRTWHCQLQFWGGGLLVSSPESRVVVAVGVAVFVLCGATRVDGGAQPVLCVNESMRSFEAALAQTACGPRREQGMSCVVSAGADCGQAPK